MAGSQISSDSTKQFLETSAGATQGTATPLQWPHPTQILTALIARSNRDLSGAQLCPATLHPALPGLERTGLEQIHLLHPAEQRTAKVQPLQLNHDGFTAAPQDHPHP